MQPEKAVWSSLRWSDGSIYEGLTTPEGHLHWSGVMQYANGDRYEGEFSMGEMHGYGAYIWKDGTVYRGEWHHGLMHGCGAAMHRQTRPVNNPLSATGGMALEPAHADMQAATSTSKQQMATPPQLEVREGKWFVDTFSGPIMSCSTQASREAAVEADVAAHVARAFITPHGMKHRHQLRQMAHGPGVQQLSVHHGKPGSEQPGALQQQHTASGQQQQGQQQAPQRQGAPAPWWAGLSWPWQQHKQSLSSPDAASVQASSSNSLGSNASPSGVIKQGPNSTPVSTTHPRLSRPPGPPGDPGGDADVRMRTRLLNEPEQARVKGLVDKLMLKALQEAQGQSTAK